MAAEPNQKWVYLLFGDPEKGLVSLLFPLKHTWDMIFQPQKEAAQLPLTAPALRARSIARGGPKATGDKDSPSHGGSKCMWQLK